MNLSQPAILLSFLMAFLITTIRGPGLAFALVYLPSLILFNQLPDIPIAHAPFNAMYAPIYGILLGFPFSGESIKLKWNMVDTIIVLLLFSATITSWTTEVFETGINTFRTELMRWVGPYFLARIVFRSVDTRRTALHVLIGIVAVLSVAALVEFRLSPYFFLHVLKNIGMGNRIQPMAYNRYGFFRVSGSVEHPIYFGNMCLILLGMIAVLARTTGTSLKNPWVALALFGSFGCLITSISFTPYVGLIAGSLFCVILVTLPWSRKLLIPMTLAVMVVLTTFTVTVAHSKLGDRPEGELDQSLYIRRMIVIESWKKAVTSGPFGYGRMLDIDENDEFDLKSVDNTYMQFMMIRGWVFVSLWISIAAFIAIRMHQAFANVSNPTQVFPLAVAISTVLGLMVAMYTVWGGAVYVIVWSIMLGLTNTLIDMVVYPELAAGASTGRGRGNALVRRVNPNRNADPRPVGLNLPARPAMAATSPGITFVSKSPIPSTEGV